MKKLVALVGSPNSGKTSLFNALTGSQQRVGNYPGITVEKKIGLVKSRELTYEVVDLPGLYSFDTRTLDEKVAKDVVLGKSQNIRNPDFTVVVIDSINLKRSLYLAFELKKLDRPMMIVLNLFDLAEKRGLEIDLPELSRYFKCPVVTASSVRKNGLASFKKSLEEELIIPSLPRTESVTKEQLASLRQLDFIQNCFKEIDTLLKKAIKKDLRPDGFTEKLDKVVLHPFWGTLLMSLVMLAIFQAVFSWASPLTDMIEGGFEWLSSMVNHYIPDGLLNSFINDGVLAGIGGFVVFLPQILLLFLMIMLFEDFGYLGRMTFLLDHFFRKLGLPGKAVMPLLSSHACAVPGMMAARTIENNNDRLATLLVAPLTTCSARIPVYTLLIAAFVPKISILGPIELPALVMMVLYLLGVGSSFVMAFIFKKTVLTGSPSRLLMELPDYKMPRLSHIAKGLWLRTKIFLKKVGKIILLLTIGVWFLVSFPRTDQGAPDLENSYAATIGKSLSPIFAPIGFDWKLTTALIPSFGAREIVVSTLATVLAVEGSEDDENFEKTLAQKVKSKYSLATILSLLIWFVYAPQCLSTFAIMKKETDSWKWTAFMGSYTLILAYVGSFMVFQIFS